MLRVSANAKVDHDLGEKRFAPGFSEVLGDIERQPIAPLTQRRIFFVKVPYPSIRIGLSGSDEVVAAFERDSNSGLRLAECGIQYVCA